ncbi:M14 family zinc carboxypeptidase [Winogradskyella sp.]|uniref:M14 family zinc carboxypeptidase n=1 Tax=Winogradskyella sp. TaxID=1883156 RepID=UPI00261DC253|nr:M14 family zinc carboxypeptidase [Winogradskyella sp.]
MKKITLTLTALLFVVSQFMVSQNQHSRITITNPTPQIQYLLAQRGIDLRCGVNHDHEHNNLTLDVSDKDRNVLDQLGISYTIIVENLQEFQSQRAINNLPRAIMEAQLEDARTIAAKSNELQLRGSVSSQIIDNYLQYDEIDEKDWVKPLNFELGSMGGCYTLSEMESELDDMRTYSQTNGLDIVSVKQDASPTGQTTWGNPASSITNNGLTYSGQGGTRWDPKTIYYVRITGNESTTAEGTKPQMLFTSMIHSRELSALMNNMYFMWYIIENYNTDPAIKELVDNNELYFVPVVNPDGLRWNEHVNPSGGAMQRKNLRPNTGGTGNTSVNRGVDLNRNFDYFWGNAGIGSTDDPFSDSYRGPSAASEPETQIMVDFILARNFKTGIWNHSFANSIPHPYGGNPTFVSGREDEMHEMHADMTKYNRYVSGATIFSPANGIADDWMLGGSIDNNGSVGSGQNILATTPEHGGDWFWPTPSDIIPIAKRSMRISLMGAYHGGKYAKFHDLTQSDISSLSPTLDFAIERVGQTASDFTLTVTPISANVTNIVSPATQSGMTVLEQRNVTASMTLDPSIQPNDVIEYKIQLSNDVGVFYEVNIEKYYQPTVIFSHNPDTDGLTGWNSSGWNNTTVDAYSGSNSLRTGNYGNNTTETLTTTNSYDLSSSSEVLVQFYAKWDIERNFDFVELQASTDGSTWVNLNGKYTKPESSASTNDHAAKGTSDEEFQGNNASGHIYDGDRMDKWVMEEIVIDAINNATFFNASTVFFRFRLRSDSGNVFENYSANREGFYLDDFKVISIQIPCATTTPTNLAANNITSAEADITWDNIPSATYDLRYRETGTSTWTEVSDLATNSYSISGLSETTEYEVQVRTRCTSSTSAYTSSTVFTTAVFVPCTGTVISSFPYSETFDSGIGDWTQDSGDDGDWSLDANGTDSNETGPSDDITGNGNYFYTEASTAGLGSNATVVLTSPCYVLSDPAFDNFSFYYHMYGTNVGSLDLEISSDNGTNWTNVFSQSGNLGNAWNAQNIDLTSYIGQTVKFRFIGTTGNGWSSDIAIDQISIGSIPAHCDSQATDTNLYLGIAGVQLNTINNTSTAQLYTDYTSVSTTLSKSTNYDITITPDYNVATTNAVGYGVWIDFNRDGDFNDSGEEVFTQSPVTGGGSVTGNFTIPSSVITGNTRMRVSLEFNAVPNPCGDFTYGEVEDYTLYIFNGLVYQGGSWTPSSPSVSTGAEDALILDGIFNATSDFSINNITVNSGSTLNLNKANAITVNGDITNNGEFVLDSDSNEFSSLMVNGTVTGNIKYNRYANSNAGGNDLIAPPVSGQTFVDFLSNNTNVFANATQTLYLFGPFEKPTNDYMLFANTEVATLEAGTGYRVASTDNGTFTFTGAVSTGNVDIPISKVGSNYEKWNLIGNPYTTYISLADFLAANITELDFFSAAVYGYDADNSNGSNWTIWNLAYSDANPGTLIAPGQGFFVSSKDGGANISFTPSMRAIGSSDDFIAGRNSSTIGHAILRMTTSSNTFETEVYFNDNATLGLDVGYDAEHFGGAPSDFSIYSELVENNQGLDMAIQAISTNEIDASTVIPLGVNAAQGQQIVISLESTNVTQDIYLEDTETNLLTHLNTSDYSFTPSIDLADIGRFYLRFGQQSLSTDVSELDRLQIYSDTDLEQIVIQGLLSEATQMTLFDIQGREILRKELVLNNMLNTVNTSSFMEGVYLVQLSNETYSITKKLIIR